MLQDRMLLPSRVICEFSSRSLFRSWDQDSAASTPDAQPTQHKPVQPVAVDGRGLGETPQVLRSCCEQRFVLGAT